MLRRAPEQGDALDVATLGKIARDPAITGLGPRWAQAKLAGAGKGLTVYVVPARGNVCVVIRALGAFTNAACDALLAVAQRGLVNRLGRDGDQTTTVVGLMPDGISTVDTVSGARKRATVNNNVFITTAGTSAGELQWTDSTGAHATSLPPSPIGGG